jgi:hypothetical protein
MARRIDPSELEGDDLVNWCRRSPAELDAEREAIRADQYKALVNSIGGAKGAVDQVDRQAEVAPNQRIEWHIAEPGAYEFFDDVTSPKRPPIVLYQTPAR